MRWPVGRPTTVRTRIVALALAPAVALMALWSFAMVSVTGELRALIRLQGVYEDFGTPVDTAIGQIQIERRLSAAYLGGHLDTDAAGELLAQQRRTDRAVNAMRDAIRDGNRDRLSDRQRQVLDTVLEATGHLERLRERVLSRDISWDRAVSEYSALVEPGFDVQSALTALQAGQLAREAQIVVELVRVREFVSREDALVAGARAAGTLTDRQYDTLTATIEDRRVFERTYVPDLPADSRSLFEEFQRGSLHRSLVRGEDALLRAGADGAGEAVAADTWRTTTDRAVVHYMRMCTRSAENSAARGRAFAYRELTKAAVVGVAGLAAVGLSLWSAVRGARRISRRLEALRDAADVLSTRQLPDVMVRLSLGEGVDATAEAPPLPADEVRSDEIGQVAMSFNTARLAAVEAAVKQATLRRGLFAVLLNIARRSQALVHRQLKLVDTLERRTDDPDILQDLFRIDHLTTRMRRHAESLIILSGAAPGRRWRRPVPVANVVSSAVSEIEDYARVEIPPMPEVGIAADAVADVVHLIAELLENATAFSPPHTQVTLRTGPVSGGFVLEIDDRGLGLDTDQLDDAHRALSGPDDFDPTRHDRLGLYVVGRLAARHGIQVTLRESPYGGTTAVVLLPPSVLADADPAPAPTPEPQPAHAGALPVRREASSGERGAGPGGGGATAAGPAAGVPRQGPAEERAGSRESAGSGARVSEAGSPGFGSGARVPQPGSSALGPGARASESGSPGFGSGARVPQPGSSALGPGARVSEAGSPGFGSGARVPQPGSSALGPGARASESGSPGFGSGARVPQPGSSALGPGARVSEAGSPGFGSGARVPQPGSSALGPGARASESGSPGFGVGARVPEAGAPAFGPGARVSESGSPGFGVGARVPEAGSSVLGSGARASETGPRALGPVEAGAVPPALPTRVRQASLAAELRDEPPAPDAVPQREVDADEMRAIFGAFQRGLDRGRKGLPGADDDTATGSQGRTDTDEGTYTDDAR
ncbi:sensor histidine kinase [Streptomyces sp. V3I7]|uniref:sensor histidine kinase n=1 Tax=Streptomyces sp. V3I7 TaxID=3042278 RepID=UPI002788F6B3|nr:sensor histidine kinase [Streptomyces sp. V3I7]MDQ0989770.1 signal transduction histidine kinase [Streptomyces sp. V3I7]